MAKRRLQITVSGLPLDYLEYRGRNARVPWEEWAGRGLASVLDDLLDNPDGDYRRWLAERPAEPTMLDD